MLRAPHQLRLGEITHISLSQWTAMRQCPLKGLLPAASTDAPLPEPLTTRAILIGRFHHRVMELAATSASNASLDREIEEEIRALQREADTFRHLRATGSVSGWDEVNKSASHAMRIVEARPPARRAALHRVEHTLRSADGLLVGRPDHFGIDGTSAYLVEHKSGALRDRSGDVDPRYVDQILFYAALILDNYPVDRVVARVESLSGERFERVVALSEAQAFTRSIREEVDQLNARVRAGEAPQGLANPSADACSACRGRSVCERFKLEQGQLGLEGEQFVIEGIVSTMGPIVPATMIRLTVSELHRRNTLCIDAPAEDVATVYPEMRVLLIDVRERGGVFEWGYGTRILRRD